MDTSPRLIYRDVTVGTGIGQLAKRDCIAFFRSQMVDEACGRFSVVDICALNSLQWRKGVWTCLQCSDTVGRASNL